MKKTNTIHVEASIIGTLLCAPEYFATANKTLKPEMFQHYPIQYKGNPATAQPAQPTKVHVEQPVFTQQDIEASEQHFAGVRAMFKQMGV